MIIWSGAIVIAGGVVSFAVSRRLNGEARIIGGYFAGFAASGLIAFLVVSLEEIQGETQQIAMLTGLKELVGLAPALGVAAAEVMHRRALHRAQSGMRDQAPTSPSPELKAKSVRRSQRSRSAR